MQVANPNRAQFTKCAGYAIPYTTYGTTSVIQWIVGRVSGIPRKFSRGNETITNLA